jgi:alanyl-tRNA synthetase
VTQRLYYDDATLRHFTAQVLEERTTEHGPAARLDRTAFYATSGGQPHDTGTLNGIPVLEVWEDEATGELWHRLARPLEGMTVTGLVDWPRRFDHMQQHTGQHLLSAAFLRLWDAPTVGFHLGREASTIDLPLSQLSWEAAFKVEDEVNQLIWEDRPVTARFVTPEELATLALRKLPNVTGPVRIVTVADYDATACGGTHVARTGEIGLAKITGLERYKGGVRVTFLCGGRALHDYRRTLRTLSELAASFTVAQEELPQALARLQEESQETRRALHKAQAMLLENEADRLWTATPLNHGMRQVVAHWSGRPFAEAQALAARLREQPQTVALLAVTEERGTRLVCARSEDLPAVDAAALLRRALARLGGKGGGTSSLAQGGGPVAPPAAIQAALQEALNG